jgi:hypothetical protein
VKHRISLVAAGAPDAQLQAAVRELLGQLGTKR